jgi:TolA-binding protein
MALIFVPKIVELVRRRSGPNAGMNCLVFKLMKISNEFINCLIIGMSGSHLNGTFHETMTSREEEERFNRLTLENEELKEKITEKEKQIDQIKTKIEQLTKQQQQQQQQQFNKKEQKQHQTKQMRKAVRIQEPDGKDDENNDHLNVINIDPISDSGFVSNRNSRPSDFEFSESYL